jgi:uncharacterized membrane protein YfcA
VIITIYLAVGAVAGILAGLLGVGGGLIIVPALMLLFVHQGFETSLLMHLSVATSLATILLTSMLSTYAHHRHGAVQWRDVWMLTPGILVGAVIGAGVADRLPTNALKNIFAIFEIIVAIQMSLSVRPAARQKPAHKATLTAAGLVTGGVSTILGIGGGTITVPFLLWCKRSIRQAVATSAACGFPIALSGVISYIILGMDEQSLPDHSLGYVYWPAFLAISVTSMLFAPLGAKWAHSLPTHFLKRLFALLLLFIGVRMLLS